MPVREDIAQPRLQRIRRLPEVIEGLGVSRSTFFRVIRPQLRVVRLSARRVGVLESDYQAFLEERAAQPTAA